MIEEELITLLINNKLTISTAESCTGGLVASMIVNVSGASSVFNEGYITYSNEAKSRLLNVDRNIIEDNGAVSEETAKLMAKGCAINAGADIGVSTTGIAGPTGGSEAKPVGLVYIGCYYKGVAYAIKCNFKGSREEVRLQAASKALEYIYEMICNQ